MNYLIAKAGRNYHKVLSQEDTILEPLNLEIINTVDYSPSYKLDEEEWFKITEFSKKDFFIEQCAIDFSTTNLNQINNPDFEKIKTLCIIQGTKRFFQKVTPSLFVRRKRFIDASGTPKIIEHRRHLELQKIVDAYYCSEDDTLYFSNLSKIKSIFPGIEALHRTATQGEVDSFLEEDFIGIEDFDPIKTGVSNRKRIADIGGKYNTLSQEKKNKLIKYAKEKSGVKLEDDQFIIDSEDSLKNLLYALDERYYRSDIYEEDRLANSIKVMK